MSTTAVDDRVMAVWEWCSAAYLQHGIKIAFPKNTDPHKTYQWRFALSITKKFEEWGFDEITAKKFISIAVGEAKKRGVLKKGLAALHQSNMLEVAHQIIVSQQKDNNNHVRSLVLMKRWFDVQVGDKDALKVLLARKEPIAYPNIIIWYRASKLSDLFMALSKSCTRAISKLQENSDESRLLPTVASLYLLRSEFLAEKRNLKLAKVLFGTDLRS